MSDTSDIPIEVDVATVSSLRRAGEDFLLLDIREEEEFTLARIEGSLLIPMSELRQRIGELDEHRDRRIVVHCHHGQRSMQVTEALRRMGFEQVQNMAGGIDAWSEQIDPGVPRY